VYSRNLPQSMHLHLPAQPTRQQHHWISVPRVSPLWAWMSWGSLPSVYVATAPTFPLRQQRLHRFVGTHPATMQPDWRSSRGLMPLCGVSPWGSRSGSRRSLACVQPSHLSVLHFIRPLSAHMYGSSPRVLRFPRTLPWRRPRLHLLANRWRRQLWLNCQPTSRDWSPPSNGQPWPHYLRRGPPSAQATKNQKTRQQSGRGAMRRL